MDRRKVKFSLTRYTKNGLYTYNKVYEDCIRNCHKVINKSNEFKGSFSQFEEIEFINDRNMLVELEVEVNYQLWFRILN